MINVKGAIHVYIDDTEKDYKFAIIELMKISTMFDMDYEVEDIQQSIEGLLDILKEKECERENSADFIEEIIKYKFTSCT